MEGLHLNRGPFRLRKQPGIASDIVGNKAASGIFLGAMSLGLGLLNAACMTY